MPPVELPVERIEQRPGLCGAATAQMILHARGLIGTTLAEQDVLFAEIQANTKSLRPPNHIKPHECPQWATQDCTMCPGETEFTCWCSFPPALETTLVNRGVAMLLAVHLTDDPTTTSVLNSIDFNMPAAVLVKGGLHWIAVAGYNPDPSPHAQMVGGRLISDILVRNPAVGATKQSIAIGDWNFDELLPVTLCGPFKNKLVMIGATAMQGPVVVAPTGLTIVPRRPVKKRKKPRFLKRPIPKPPGPGPKREKGKARRGRTRGRR